MKILVTIKQVPDTNNVTIDKKTGTLNREGIPSIINPEDRHAIEAAISIKEKHGGTITVMTMGPPQAMDALREALAMGADEAVLLSDRKFAGADTLATAYTLSRGVIRLGGFDIIVGGRQAIDGDTAQVGPQLAGFLDIPQITYVCDVEVDPAGRRLIATRETDDELQKVAADFPVLLTVIKELNAPRYPSISGIMEAFESDVMVLTAHDIAVDPEQIGLQGSPTQVHRTFTPAPRGEGVKLSGSFKEVSSQATHMLKEKGLL